MNLLEKMNAEEFKKLLEYKEKFPTIGEDLIQELTVKSFPMQLTLGECIDLSNAVGIPFDNFALGIFDTFKSKP
jgi:hypothetical protein